MTAMDLAPSVSTRRVHGRALNPDGSPATGFVEFMLSLTHLAPEDNVTLVDGPVTAPVDETTGDWSIVVPVTDEADLEPAIAAYGVRIPGSRSLRSITVPAGPGDLRYVDAPESIVVPAEMLGVALTGLTIGRVETLPPGSLGTAEITGGAPEPELNLGIPQGPQGNRPSIEVGTVTTGAAGSDVTITWSGIGSVPNPYRLNITIPRGDRPVIELGPITTLPANDPAAGSWSGDGSILNPYRLALALPQGVQGPQGRSIVSMENTTDPRVAQVNFSSGDPDLLTLPVGEVAGIDDSDFSTTGLWSSSKVRSLLLTPRARTIGLLTECVIVGSSNAVGGTWGPTFCSAWGLTERNVAIGGGGYNNVGNGTFLSQLQAAASSAAFANADVGMVVIADASNDIRAKVSVASAADTALAYARTTFPNARIIVLPVIWPADPVTQAAGTGGYQADWHEWLRTNAAHLLTACRKNGCEFVDQSWTWLTGMTGVMETSGGVHPNAAGYTEIARWLSAYLRGESPRRDTPWTQVAAPTGTGGARVLSARREGWKVDLQGTAWAYGSGPFMDLAAIPAQFRPPYEVATSVTLNAATGSAVPGTIYPNGVLRIWQSHSGTLVGINAVYQYG